MSEARIVVSQSQPQLREDSLPFSAALLLLVGPPTGFNIDKLARRTRVARPTVAVCARRLFDNEVWHPEGPVYDWETVDDARFWQDVGVAEGRLQRRRSSTGRLQWAPAGAWRKKYDYEEAPVTLGAHYLEELESVVTQAGEYRQAQTQEFVFAGTAHDGQADIFGDRPGDGGMASVAVATVDWQLLQSGDARQFTDVQWLV